MPSRKKVRLIHTSDVHLGDPMGHPTAEEALRAVVDAVLRLHGDMLLLVGDIFDNGRVSDAVVQSFLEQVARLDAPAILLPGNHDLYDEGSVYQRKVFDAKPPNLHIISETEGQAITFPGHGLGSRTCRGDHPQHHWRNRSRGFGPGDHSRRPGGQHRQESGTRVRQRRVGPAGNQPVFPARGVARLSPQQRPLDHRTLTTGLERLRTLGTTNAPAGKSPAAPSP